MMTSPRQVLSVRSSISLHLDYWKGLWTLSVRFSFLFEPVRAQVPFAYNATEERKPSFLFFIFPMKEISLFLYYYPSFSSLLVSRTLLCILADLNNVLVWMVSIRSPISKFFSPFTNPLETVQCALITCGITVTFMFHSFF